jgi:hypothetical protein
MKEMHRPGPAARAARHLRWWPLKDGFEAKDFGEDSLKYGSGNGLAHLTFRVRFDSSGHVPIRFDARLLFEALDAQRQERGISWKQAAEEIGVSPSTLTRTRLGGRMEVDGMLAMTRWLGRTAESFTRSKPF